MSAWATRKPIVCVCGDHAFVAITKGYTTMVSADDANLLNDIWFAIVTPRAVRVGRRVGPRGSERTIILAREVIHPDDSQYADHRNCDPLDNRRSNLRASTPAQNALNRRKESGSKTPFKGVRQQRDRFYASIMIDGRRQALGGYATAEEAHAAYAAGAARLHGEFARTA